MTHPLTPRENLTRPIVGIENRTAHEVFDIMSDRFRAHLTDLASGSGDHAELARLADMADWMADGDPGANGSVLLSASVASEHAADLRAILAENAALRAEHVHLVEQKEGAEDALFNALSRDTEAERKLDEAVEIVRSWLMQSCEDDQAHELQSRSRTFLSKEAERG